MLQNPRLITFLDSLDIGKSAIGHSNVQPGYPALSTRVIDDEMPLTAYKDLASRVVATNIMELPFTDIESLVLFAKNAAHQQVLMDSNDEAAQSVLDALQRVRCLHSNRQFDI
jgi:hypothetical protein